jgi:phosphodiesterase/alkaline phosphatase D-like protein
MDDAGADGTLRKPINFFSPIEQNLLRALQRPAGYVSVDVDAKQMTTQLRVVSDVTDPKASVSTLKTFAVENGKPGVVTA